MNCASSSERKLPAAQFPTNVVSLTGMSSVPPRLTPKPAPRDSRTTRDAGAAWDVGSQPGARTTYAVLAEHATVLCGAEEAPGGIPPSTWNDTASQNAS